MLPTPYWIDTPAAGRLATMACPRGGEQLAAELAALRRLGAETLVCLLTVEERSELDLPAEEACAVAAGLVFRVFPIPDFTVPPIDRSTIAFIGELAAATQAGGQIVVHCRAGIGRSSLIVASTLTMLGLSPAEAFARISTARGRPVPDTAEQRRWVDQFAQQTHKRCTTTA